MINTNKIDFITSAADSGGFVVSELPQIVFAGRSNVGKSSVINSLARRKNLARVGNTPGKTLHVNYFDADGKLLWVDFPGYGYAKVSFSEKERWAGLIEAYFANEKNISLGVVIVDIRHKPTELDIMMKNYFAERNIDFVIVANKCDKLKPSEREEMLEVISATLALKGEGQKLLAYSAEKNTGREELFEIISNKEGKTE